MRVFKCIVKQMKYRFCAALVVALVVVTQVITVSCSSRSQQPSDTEISIPITETPEPFIHPDTIFPSIEGMKYSITVFDSITSGKIDNYDDPYATAPGIMTFRGNLERTAPFVGVIQGTPDTLVTEWTFRTRIDNRPTNMGTWGGGTGWTGQPLYVEWPDSLVEAFRRDTAAHATLPSNKEIIFGSLNSYVHFLDYETGKMSRDTLYVHNPIKGTLMLDPKLNGRLYVGHGVLADEDYSWGQLTIDLYKHRVMHYFRRDHRAWRGWEGNDASSIRVGQFVFHVSENGTVYKWLDTPDGRKLHSTLRYRMNGRAAPGMEGSMSVWGNYGYCNDNHGNVVCINLGNLQPVWRYDNHDDCDCTPVVSHEAEGTFVYTGSEVDRHPHDSLCHFVKLNALTGDTVWTIHTRSARFEKDGKHFDGGYYSTPLLGSGNCANLIFNNRVLNTEKQNGEFVAIDRKTGVEVYTTHLKTYAWSSPVGFLNEKGEFYILTFDTVGFCYIIDGATGQVLFSRRVGGNFESSPIVIDNHVVVGSRNGNMYKFRIGNKAEGRSVN